MSWVAVPGGKLHVLDEGTGPPIVLLHSGITDLREWDDLAPRLTSAGFRVIRFDRRGTGGSRSDPVAFRQADDAVAVMDALGVDRTCLVGCSYGGAIAIETALEHPGRVGALVLLAPGLGGFDGDVTPAEEAQWEATEELEARGDVEAAADANVRLWGDGPGQPEGRLRRELRERLMEMARGAVDQARERGEEIQPDPPAATRLEELTMPILAVVGDLDISYMRAVVRELRSRTPHTVAVELPGVAHMVAMEAPAETADRIVDMLPATGAWMTRA